MKKINLILLGLLGLFSCNKSEEKKDSKNQETTQTKENNTTIENQSNSITTLEKNAIDKDKNQIYKHSFLLKKDSIYPFTTHQRDEVKVTAPNGQSQTMVTENIDEVTFLVNDFKENIYDITINFVRKKTTQSNGKESISIDTQANAPKDQGLKNKWSVDKALVNNQLKMKMDIYGKILSITGFEPIYTKISNALTPLVKDAQMRKAIIEQTKASFNEKALKEQFGKNIVFLPEKGAKIGEKWNSSENISPDGSVKLSTQYTLKNVENHQVEISLNGGIPKKSNKQTQNGITHSVSSEVSQNGTIIFDQKTGWIKSQKINITTTQSETLSDGKQTEKMSSVTKTSAVVNP